MDWLALASNGYHAPVRASSTQRTSFRPLAGLATSLLVLALTGCAARMERRAEAVFRDYNDLLSGLMLDVEAVGDDRRKALERAESDLVAACAPLNRAAARRRDGAAVEGRMAIAASIDRCECRTRQVRSLLAGETARTCPVQ